MVEKSLNNNLHRAKNSKEDEFYTQLSDIDKELKHYKNHFKDKVIYCNCDDPRVSNFFHYFSYNFEKLGLKKLITTCFQNQNADLFSQNDSEKALLLEYNGDKNGNNIPDPEEIGIVELNGDGDFRSKESIELLKQADIVVTNPPFSLFREYVAQLIEYDKKFIIIGSQNAVTYKEIFSYIRENKLWVGYKSGDMEFKVPEYYEKRATRFRQDENGQKWRSLGNICWFTNLDISKRHEDIILYKKYSKEEYPKYDNYDAINVGKVAEIPLDYKGAMGVPITFLSKYNPKQFEIISSNDIRINDKIPFKQHGLIKDKDGTINGIATYVRIVIKNKRI
ncbi:adenine-specific methyltransferase EcoRI family protein [Tenacibaculum finnmarkense]|uniref:adenine-specific methyltransferase EcoRI family protein n=1 Tax=Tenacibaculum finnmarkense TaxID=2781243 RepID=UPI001EFB26C5|nr:adenine-specific methyltransferase EcoRI family protein [Tenacibaculum finnmarkense]MCG8796669.1 modification methylase [Tenacibaculum finnmarkense]MCG8799013.1 modification methylase [Tenacibaculum finnmarkense]